MVFGVAPASASRSREAPLPLLGMLLLVAVMVVLGVCMPAALTACSRAQRRSSLVDATPMLEGCRNGWQAGPASSAVPAPRTSTARLRQAADVPAAVAELCAAGMALATLVATDEEQPASAISRYATFLSRPRTACAPWPDVFVTLVTSLNPTRPELPSISVEVPAAQLARTRGRRICSESCSPAP